MGVARAVIYFAHLGDADTADDLVARRLTFVGRQLAWLAHLIGTAEPGIEILVPYVAPRAWDEAVHRAITRHGGRIDPASIEADRADRFEYPGLRCMKDLAEKSSPDALIYYCHSKGVTHLDETKLGLFRLHTQIALSAKLDRLTADPSLTRASLFPSRWGWCWYNLFWIKAGYMALRTVEPSADRHHFEALIGDRADAEGYRGVLPLIDYLPFSTTGIQPRPWYRAAETISPTLHATYDRYARLDRPPLSIGT